MIKADQQLLYQATNQGFLHIRQAEISYYQSLNVAFGTQAALIGGFTYGVFTINPINEANNYPTDDVNIIADVYWTLSAITVALSVHVIMCTMLLQVLGPGLALHGPVGSMARATEGMRFEQRQIVISFIGMMMFFSLSTLMSFWVVMNFEAAVACSICFGIASCYWFHYCERIYLRFYWDKEATEFNERENSMDSNDNDPANQHVETSNARDRINNTRDNSSHGAYGPKKVQGSRKGFLAFVAQSRATAKNMFASRAKKSSRSLSSEEGKNLPRHWPRRKSTNGSVMGRSDSGGSVAGGAATGQQDNSRSHSITNATNWAVVSLHRGVTMEGYLTKKSFKIQNGWERYYFTLSQSGQIFVYSKRQVYRDEPKNPLFSRPLELRDYYISWLNQEEMDASETGTHGGDNMSVYSDTLPRTPRTPSTNAPSIAMSAYTTSHHPVDSQPHFQMTLVLREEEDNVAQGIAYSAAVKVKKEQWVLRCDTESELDMWISAMREVSPSSFR